MQKCNNSNCCVSSSHKLRILSYVFPINEPRCDFVINIQPFHCRHCCATVWSVLWIGDRNLTNRRLQQRFDSKLFYGHRGILWHPYNDATNCVKENVISTQAYFSKLPRIGDVSRKKQIEGCAALKLSEEVT